MNKPSLHFIDNRGLKGREDKYISVSVSSKKILESWKSSLFSFEWLTPDGKIRSLNELGELEKQKFEAITLLLKNGDAIEKPILGIGILDNVEIGSRRDIFLTLAVQGISSISVHILKTDEKDFEGYLAK